MTADLSGHALATFVERPGESSNKAAIAPDSNNRYASLVQSGEGPPTIDNGLLRELIQTALQVEHHPELYRAYATQAQARAVEEVVIVSIVSTYKDIKLNQQQPQVQTLNALLP